MSTQTQPSGATFGAHQARSSRIVGNGLMATLIRDHHWPDTPLGPIDDWSDALIGQVNLLLQCPLPATLSLGPDLTFLYNDATIPTLDGDHPAALGQSYRDVFRQAWHLVGSELERCLQGEPTIRENVLIPLERKGQVQPFYWNYSLMPVYEHGEIIGVFNFYQNTTEAVEVRHSNEALNQRLSQVLNSTSDCVVTFDREWTITYMNPHAEAILGRVGPVLGTNTWQSFPSQVFPGSPYVEHYQRAMYEGIGGDFEAFYPEPLNLWFSVQARPAPDGIVIFFRDITQEKRSAQALETITRHLQLAQQAGRVATWSWNVKTNEIIWSGDIASIYGRPASENAPFERAFSHLHEEDRQAAEKAIRDPLHGIGEYSHEFRSVWPDGSIHWSLAQGSPLFSAEGEATHMTGIVLDITERKTAQHRIQTERDNLAALFEETPAILAIHKGAEHRYELVNRAHQDLIGNRECIGCRPIDVLPESTATELTDILDSVYRTGVPHVNHNSMLAFYRGPGGEVEQRCIDFVYQPRRDADGKVCGIICLCIDRTDRWRAQQALIQTEKLAAVGRLASSIAHEINNPLAAVTNFLYLAGVSTNLAEIRQYLSIVENELRRVAVISNHTLLSQKRSIKPGLVRLGELIDSVLFLYRARARDQGITVVTTYRPQPSALCLEGEIRQVLGNLIANALEAMSPGGRLLIRSRLATNWKTGRPVHRTTIADTGSGIDFALAQRIFEPFFTTKGTAGNGLGLWVCREIMDRHKGRLLVRSQTRQPGSGSVFVLTLPAQPKPLP